MTYNIVKVPNFGDVFLLKYFVEKQYFHYLCKIMLTAKAPLFRRGVGGEDLYIMNTKITFIALFFAVFCFGQTKEFIIGDYMLVPERKEVRVYTQVGGVNWDGATYEKTNINYEKTTLLLLGDEVLFKEKFPFNFDVNTLKIIYYDDFVMLFKDKNAMYYSHKNYTKSLSLSLEGYQAINDFIYTKQGKNFFIDFSSPEELVLREIDIPVDVQTLHFVIDNYYYDKNGLYYFGQHYKLNEKGYYDNFVPNSEQIAAAKNQKAILGDKYIIFGENIFAIKSGHHITPLKINAQKIKQYTFYDNSETLISDGKSMYYDNSGYGYGEYDYNDKGLGSAYPILYSGIDLKGFYSCDLKFELNDKQLIFNKYSPDEDGGIVTKIGNNLYVIKPDEKPIKIDKILFYHLETKATTVFEEKYLKVFKNGFLQYKNQLYFDSEYPVDMEGFEMENLHQIPNSNYLTDGKSLLYTGSITGMGIRKKNGVEYANFERRILKNTYNKEMKVINAHTLSDGKTLIHKGKKVKISDLGLSVKIVPNP
ncbi:MAG: hypothetical protein Q4C98_10020 [Capnocytophaga sp.]|nr:hypothetical protein [Capnocytophaga sp.]